MTENITGRIGDSAPLDPLGVGLDSLDIDIHRGANDFPDITAQLPNSESEDIQQFGVRFEDAVKHMSVHKYESEASMIREYVANMASTCLDAQEQDALGDEYSPVIHIAYYPSSETLIMEDNGMGMSADEIDTVGVQLGVSTNRYTSDRGGKYGIGLLSGLKGVGLDGAFFMHSRSRRTDEYVKGLWTAYGFKRVDELPDKLEDGQYGTRFEFPMKDPEIDIQSSIAQVAQWSRIPVLYTERNTDGSLIVDDEWGGRSATPFQDHFPDTDGDLVIEKEAFRAVHSPHAAGRAVLLDVPIDRNFDSNALGSGTRDFGRELPYGFFDVVFKSEDQEIVAGPHEGLTRVSDGEYAQMPDERAEGYIPARECAPSDVWTPSPAGDRDRFEENPEFWRWLAECFIDVFDERLERTIEDAVAAERVLDLPREGIEFIVCWMDNQTYKDDWGDHQLQSRLDDWGLEDIDDHTLVDFARMSNSLDRCKRGQDPWKKSGRSNTRIYDVLLGTPDDADVWMATHPSEKKASVVWDDHDGHTVVRVPESRIEGYEERFGWRRLNYVSEATLDEFDISDDIRARFERNYDYSNPNAGKTAPNREVTLHYARLSDKTDRGFKDTTEKETARYLRAYFEARAAGTTPERESLAYPINRLILFPSNSEETMSDYLGVLGHDRVRLATCTVGVWEYLKDCDRVSRIEDYLDAARSLTLPTSEGKLSLPEARQAGETLILHLVTDDVLPGLRDQPEMTEAASWYEQEAETDGFHRQQQRDVYEGVVYAPVTRDTIERVLPILSHDDVFLATHETNYPIPAPSLITNPGRDTELYAYANLSKWRETTEYDILSGHKKSLSGGTLNDGMLGVIDGFADLHDAGVTVPSERERIENETYTTMLEVLGK